MAGFIGEYPCKVDPKGRILFPSALKKQLHGDGDGFVVKKDLFEKCLVLYTMEEWNRQNELIREKLNAFNKDHNRFLRGFYRGTAELSIDANSRMLFPKRLLDEIGVDKDIVLSGQDSKIEIWAKEVYDGIEEDEADFALLAQTIMKGNERGE